MDQCFNSKRQAYVAVNEAIPICNQERPHLALNYLTPAQKYQLALQS